MGMKILVTCTISNKLNICVFVEILISNALKKKGGGKGTPFLCVLKVVVYCNSDLEKVVNHPQAENSELYNFLKIK